MLCSCSCNVQNVHDYMHLVTDMTSHYFEYLDFIMLEINESVRKFYWPRWSQTKSHRRIWTASKHFRYRYWAEKPHSSLALVYMYNSKFVITCVRSFGLHKFRGQWYKFDFWCVVANVSQRQFPLSCVSLKDKIVRRYWRKCCCFLKYIIFK